MAEKSFSLSLFTLSPLTLFILGYIFQYMQTTVIFKADKKLKEAAQKAAKSMGIPFSAVMNQYMRKFVEEQEIAFSAKYYNPTPYLRRILDQQEKDFKTGKNIKTYNSLEELMAAMEK